MLIPSLFADLQFAPVPTPTTTEQRNNRLRGLTAPHMQCPKCRRDLYITPSGFLCCQDFNCGRLLNPSRAGRNISTQALRLAWPERSIEGQKQ